MSPELYHELYGCHCPSPDPTECDCIPGSRPDYEVCIECGSWIVEDHGEAIGRDEYENALCEECFEGYLADQILNTL